MNSLEEIKAKLRAKGIAFDANKLKKGLLNQKHCPSGQDETHCGFEWNLGEVWCHA